MAASMPISPKLSPWHKLDRFLARLRPHREPLSLAIDALMIVLAWNATYLFRLGFERWLKTLFNNFHNFKCIQQQKIG